MYQYYSAHGTILRWLQDTGSQKVSFFTRNPYFVWYEVGSRICDLVRKGYVFKSGKEKGDKGQTYAIYSLTEKGQDYKIPEPTLFERIKHNFNIWNSKT